LMVTREVSRVTALLHDRGIVHRDIKGSNVLLRAGSEQGVAGSVVLVDLGIARGLRKHGTACTEIGMALGSLPYMAPEVIAATGEPQLSPANDVFGIGVLAWLMLFQTHPSGLSMNHDPVEFVRAYLYGSPTYPEAEAEAVHRLIPGLIPVLARAVEFAPERRFPNARELFRALVQVELRCEDDEIHTEVHPLGPMVARPSLTTGAQPSLAGVEPPPPSREVRPEISYRESFISSLPMPAQMVPAPQPAPQPEPASLVSTRPPTKRGLGIRWLAIGVGLMAFVVVIVAAAAWRWMGW
jgi:serine/threonine protein kinase